MPYTSTTVYQADCEAAEANLKQNRYGYWYDRDAAPEDESGTLAFQRLRHPLFTPAIGDSFKIQAQEQVFVIGSCFARAIEYLLARRGLDVLSASSEFSTAQTINEYVRPLGVTNKVNTFAICHELSWALDPNSECPRESIVDLGNGLVADPHVNPTLPLADVEETQRRRSLISSINRKVANCRVVIITLESVEVWRDILADTYLNAIPPADARRRYPGRYEFQVTDFAQNLATLEKIHALLECFGRGGVQIVVAVSPSALMRTFSPHDIVLANTYSKSLLRAVAQQWAAEHDNVHYFPSYEIAMNSDRALTWQEDLRHVKPAIVKHIIDVFVRSYLC